MYVLILVEDNYQPIIHDMLLLSGGFNTEFAVGALTDEPGGNHAKWVAMVTRPPTTAKLDFVPNVQSPCSAQ